MKKKTWFLYPVLFLCGMAMAYGIYALKIDTLSKPAMPGKAEDNFIIKDELESRDADVGANFFSDFFSGLTEWADLPDEYYLSLDGSDQSSGNSGDMVSDFTIKEARDFVISVKKNSGSVQIRFTEHESGTELFSSDEIGEEWNDTLHLEPGFYRFHLNTNRFRGVIDVKGVETQQE